MKRLAIGLAFVITAAPLASCGDELYRSGNPDPCPSVPYEQFNSEAQEALTPIPPEDVEAFIHLVRDGKLPANTNGNAYGDRFNKDGPLPYYEQTALIDDTKEKVVIQMRINRNPEVGELISDIGIGSLAIKIYKDGERNPNNPSMRIMDGSEFSSDSSLDGELDYYIGSPAMPATTTTRDNSSGQPTVSTFQCPVESQFSDILEERKADFAAAQAVYAQIVQQELANPR